MSFFLHGTYHGEVIFAGFCPILDLWNVLKVNAIKRLTPHFRALRATFPLPEKIFFSTLKSCALNDLK